MKMGSSASIGFPGQSVSAAVADLKSAACPLCDARNSLSLFTQSSYTLMHCEECDLSFIHPYPKNVKQHHEAVSEYKYAEMEVVRCATQYKNEKLFYERYFELVDAECREASSFLDVGCGCGHLLERLAVHDKLQRVGIELNRERAEFARKTAGCEIVEAPIEDFGAQRHFDVIALINVISHIPDIGQLFGRLRCLLAEGGRVIIKTGEMKREVKKSALFDWEFPDHLHFLGWRTLEYICARHGFRVRKHLRTTLAKERFAASTWRMKGRSGMRNAIKTGVAHMPFALELLASCYDAVHHGSISSSFIVLQAE
jgi:2-polyprenyl-3-methyl-5-hydroxy-6-metoxy-1,4-benzoquinol methylase